MALISATDLKSHMGISDSTEDPLLSAAATAACAQIGAWCNNGGFDKTATSSVSARVFRPRDEYLCIVDDFWSTTNLVVKTDEGDTGTYDTTWTITTDFILEPLNGRRNGQTWPYSRIVSTGNRSFPLTAQNRATVQVTAAWGWESYPEPVRAAALIQAARIFKRKDSPEGVLGGYDQFGIVRVSTRLDPDVETLLAPYRRASSFGIC